MLVIKFLGRSRAGADADRVAFFKQGLNEAGYADGQNIAIEYRFAEGPFDRLPALAVDLLRRNPSVIS